MGSNPAARKVKDLMALDAQKSKEGKELEGVFSRFYKEALKRDIRHIDTMGVSNPGFFDFYVEKDGSTFECKNDLDSYKYGNAAVQVASGGRASGIVTSKAKYYIHRAWYGNEYKVFAYLRTEMLEYIRENKDRLKIVHNAGYQGINSLFLINMSEFVNLSFVKIIPELSGNNYAKYLKM